MSTVKGGYMLLELNEKPIAYKPNEAARLMGISERKLDELIATKQIRSFKIGKSRRITLDAINAFIKKAEQEAR
jgi:excisionase family DNA binding protein